MALVDTGARITKRGGRRWGRRGLAATLVMAIGAGPAAAEICNMQVFDSVNGELKQKADTQFLKEDQFVVCVTAAKAGFVSLWDRIPSDGPVERLGPSPHFEDDTAREVAAGQTVCFGDGKPAPNGARYLLNMDPNDGDGLGVMWIVYSDTLEDHPGDTSFNSIGEFAMSVDRAFGAGARDVDPAAATEATLRPSVEGECVTSGHLNFVYRVEKRPGSS